jgi:hypothetical protein
MFKKLVLTAVLSLLFLATSYAEDNQRIMQLLQTAKEIHATDTQVAVAIEGKLSLKEFEELVLGTVRINAPDSAPVGSPVTITQEGIPANSSKLWRLDPVTSNQKWIQLYDEELNPVNIYWSLEPGRKTFELIVATNGENGAAPNIEIASHTLDYSGAAPGPVPPVPPVPPAPELKELVTPLVSFVARMVDSSDALILAEFYGDFATVIRDDNTLETTESFRNVYVRAGQAMSAETGLQGKYSGLPEIVDGILADSIGLQIVPLDNTLTADTLYAISWAFATGGAK